MSDAPPVQGEPLFGSRRRYDRDSFDFIATLEEVYGDVARFDMGPMDTDMLTGPEDIERVLVSEADAYRKPDFQGDALGNLLGDGLLLSSGDTWAKQRDLATPAFRMSRLAGSPTTPSRWSSAAHPRDGRQRVQSRVRGRDAPGTDALADDPPPPGDADAGP